MIVPKQGMERIGRRLKLRDLRILMTVVECGTMGKAAARLAVSQPVVSKAIADLEHALGVRLLDRSRRGVEPTPYGRALIKRGVAIFDEMRQGIEEIEFLSDPTAGEVRIGATDPINAAIVAPVIDRLSRQYPRMTFYVVAGVPGPLRQEVAARNVDFAISRFARPAGEEYSEEILFHDALVVATGPNNPLTRRRRKIELAELLSEPWVLDSPNTDFGAMQAAVFRAAGLDPPRLTVEATSIILRNELLATERFLTVVVSFSLLLPRKHPGLKALPVKLPDIRQPVGITTLKNRSLSPVAQMFIESVRELVKPLADSMGIDDQVGSLKPGKRADIITVTTRALNMGGFADAAHLLIGSALPENVDTVVIDGRILKRDGKLTSLSEGQVVADARAAVEGIRKRANWR